jgi:hypothetical protein
MGGRGGGGGTNANLLRMNVAIDALVPVVDDQALHRLKHGTTFQQVQQAVTIHWNLFNTQQITINANMIIQPRA